MTAIKKVIIATHGTLAEGFRNTIELIAGPQDEIIDMCFYNGENNYEDEIDRYFTELENDSQLIICTDMQYGSVNQLFMKKIIEHPTKNIQLLSGVNLPLLLEIVMTPNIVGAEKMTEMIKKAANQIVQVKTSILLGGAECDELF